MDASQAQPAALSQHPTTNHNASRSPPQGNLPYPRPLSGFDWSSVNHQEHYTFAESKTKQTAKKILYPFDHHRTEKGTTDKEHSIFAESKTKQTTKKILYTIFEPSRDAPEANLPAGLIERGSTSQCRSHSYQSRASFV